MKLFSCLRRLRDCIYYTSCYICTGSVADAEEEGINHVWLQHTLDELKEIRSMSEGDQLQQNLALAKIASLILKLQRVQTRIDLENIRTKIYQKREEEGLSQVVPQR